MKRAIHTLMLTSLRRYIVIGLSVYAVELFCIFILLQFSAGEILAVAASFWIGLVLSFLLQKLITFKDHQLGRKRVASQFLAVLLLVLFNFGFTILFTRLLASLLPIYITRTIALGITTLWNFYLYKTRIFARSGALPPVE